MNTVVQGEVSELNAGPNAFLFGRARTIIHITVGLLLIAAAVLKAYQAVAGPIAFSLTAALFDFALIEFELILGGMLVLNVRPVAAWALAIGAFTIFAGVSLKKAMAGASACGCFGPAAVDPR